MVGIPHIDVAPESSPEPLGREVGDEAFFAAAREWLTRHDDGTGTTEDFQAIHEEVSGQDLDAFFDTWLRTPSKPPFP